MSTAESPEPDETHPPHLQPIDGLGDTSQVIGHFEERLPSMIEAIRTLAAIESPASDISQLNICAEVLRTYLTDVCGPAAIEVVRLGAQQIPNLVVRLGERTDVLLVGHFDTVHPVGTLLRNPIRIEGDRLYGPGVLDMKTGVVIMAEIARYLNSVMRRPNVTLVINSDEEMGSVDSKPLIQELSRGVRTAMVFESTVHEGLIKVGARGVRRLHVVAHGKGGHVAYAEHNVNPVDAIADVIASARRYHKPAEGIVVVPTVITGSDAINVVPHIASVTFDIRGATEQKINDAVLGVRRIQASDERVELTFEQLLEIPTFEMRDDNRAFDFLKKAANMLDFAPLRGTEARGAGDVNNVAPIAPHVVEGVGGWGDGLHDSEREHVMVSSIAPSAALAGLAARLCLEAAS